MVTVNLRQGGVRTRIVCVATVLVASSLAFCGALCLYLLGRPCGRRVWLVLSVAMLVVVLFGRGAPSTFQGLYPGGLVVSTTNYT